MTLGMSEVIEKARSGLNKLTGLEISSTLGATKSSDGEFDGWKVTMEVVEKHSIPDGMDILATYESKLDPDGNMMKFNRVRMRKRIDTEESEE